MSPSPEILGVMESGLYVGDLERALAWYRPLLGEPFSLKPGRHAFFRLGPTLLLLFVAEATEQDAVLPPHGARGRGHVALQIEFAGLEPWRARLAGLGIELLHEQHWGERGVSLYFRDPDGNLLELITRGSWFGGDGL